MSILADQTRLRRIVETLLPGGDLDQIEAEAMLQFVQVAAGADDVDDPSEHSIVQNIAQRICALSGKPVGDVMPIGLIRDTDVRRDWMQRLGAQLASRQARELTFAFVFLTTVADLQITDTEREALEEVQLALAIDHVRATDLVVFLTETVASEDEPARPGMS